MTRLALVDYGAGNLLSIGQALTLAGAEVSIVSRPDELRSMDGIVLPGVGASGPAMERLRAQGLETPIIERARAGLPYLGVCLGLQLLFEQSDEDGATMLGLLPGTVKAIPDAPRLPHIGWNQIEQRRSHLLLEGVADDAAAYFVHSYAGVPSDPADIVAETEHGGRFPSVVARGSIMGTQFHPERSGRDGVRILRNFVAYAANRAADSSSAANAPSAADGSSEPSAYRAASGAPAADGSSATGGAPAADSPRAVV